MNGNLTVPKQVVKRNGAFVAFDLGKVERCVRMCYSDFEGEENRPTTPVETIVESVVNAVAHKFRDGTAPNVEQIQDLIETALMMNDEYEAARRYILYRDEHAKQRVVVPAEVAEAFTHDREFFPTPLQQFMFYDKYSRFNWELGRRETWPETVDRVVDYLTKLSGGVLGYKVYDRIRHFIFEMKAMPSMRALSQAGPSAERNSMSIYNCFRGSETFLTQEGVLSFAETVGKTHMIVNGEGQWVKGTIHSFGVQPLREITFRPGARNRTAIRHHVTATPDHRWITTNRGEVTDLRPGDRVKFVGPLKVDFNLEAWIAGFGFGDGTITSQGEAQVRLCGKKVDHLHYFADYGHCGIYYPPSNNGEPTIIFHKGYFTDWKKLPANHDTTYLQSWLLGYLSADGHHDSRQPGISSQNADAIEFVKKIAPLCGFMVTGHNISSVMETNFGRRSAFLHRLTLREEGEFIVTSVEDLGIEEEVFCAIVQDGHDFALANGIHTGNCSYLPVCDTDAFAEAMLISLAGCGVGYSVERQYVEQFPRVKRQTGRHEGVYIIEDSSEGWAESVRHGIKTWMNGEDVEFNYRQIEEGHPAGTPLKIKGGRASGPEPLRYVLDFCRRIVLSRQGSFLRPIDAHDMMCVVGGAAVSGGVRRTAMIALFDYDDHEMRTCKDGASLDRNQHRWNANNSAVWPEQIGQLDLIKQFTQMYENHRGEPGIFSRENANQTKPIWRKPAAFGSNPCGEINLRPYEFCNLTIAVARPDDTWQSLREKIEVATIIGTIQSLATHFPGMRPEWKKNCEDERLLGVDITGERDCPLFEEAGFESKLFELQTHARIVNREYAHLLGINESAAITCNKPNGNSSQLLGTSSGIHAQWSRFYIRNIRVSPHTPIYRVLKSAGVPMDPENGQSVENATSWVIHFPVKAPEGAKTRKDFTAIDQCEFWLRNKMYWTEHNPSVTITYEPDELLAVTEWVWTHRELIGGMAFLPSDDARYAQMPYEEITEEQYEKLIAEFPEVDFSLLYAYERSDMTTAAQEVACTTGECEL